MIKNNPPLTIRAEQHDDYEAVLQLTYHAFLTLDYPERQRMDEHYLVHLFRDSESVVPGLSFVAERDGEIVGHILYARSKIVGADGSEKDTITFGPLSVLPKYHKTGIGAALVAFSMNEAKSLGYGAVMIAGVPEYYPKLGFKRASEYGISLPDGTSPDSLMVYELVPSFLDGGGTAVFLPPEYEQCESVDGGYDEFHNQFMKEYYPGQVVLRPFWEADNKLMESWLYKDHVAKWYIRPENWLHELNNRRGEFSFISHFIAEVEGKPIGFCQYYDCFFAQKYEAWSNQWQVGKQEGSIFSIDYLIGEQEYIGKGYGKEIVRLLSEKIRDLGGEFIIVQPEQANLLSRSVLEANDFVYNGEEFVKNLRD